MWQLRTEHYSEKTDQLISVELWDVSWDENHREVHKKIAHVEFDAGFRAPGSFGVVVLKDEIPKPGQ